MDDELKEKSIGSNEAAGGTIGGAAGAHIFAALSADFLLPAVKEQIRIAAMTAHETFLAKNPLSVDANADTVTNWEKSCAAAVEEAIAPLRARAEALTCGNPIKRPFAVFKELTSTGRIALGAAVVASAIGGTLMVNKWRNLGYRPENVERLPEQRLVADAMRPSVSAKWSERTSQSGNLAQRGQLEID